jgi:hypothetical protein
MVTPEDADDPFYEPEDFAAYEQRIDIFLKEAFADPSVRQATFTVNSILRSGLTHFIVGRYNKSGWGVSYHTGILNTYFTFNAPKTIRPRRWYLLWLA